MERYEWEPGGWVVRVDEVSPGVYEIRATSPEFGEIQTTTTNPDAALVECRTQALVRSGRTNAPD